MLLSLYLAILIALPLELTEVYDPFEGFYDASDFGEFY